jgi:hypothetical protein
VALPEAELEVLDTEEPPAPLSLEHAHEETAPASTQEHRRTPRARLRHTLTICSLKMLLLSASQPAGIHQQRPVHASITRSFAGRSKDTFFRHPNVIASHRRASRLSVVTIRAKRIFENA